MPGPEDPEPKKGKCRQHQRQGILERGLIVAETLRELAEQHGADADNDGKHQHLDKPADIKGFSRFPRERHLSHQTVDF